MALYEQRLQDDLSHIRERVRTMGTLTEVALNNAVHALITKNRELANDTVLSDHPINRMMREIDRLCHGFIARHLPSAGHLRLISSIIRLNIALERIGDYAVTISREALQLTNPIEGIMAHEVESVADESKQILRQALTAFYENNADTARLVMKLPGQLESEMDGIYGLLINGEHTQDSKEMFAISVILTQLKRVADQAKNICEETIFALTGETKAKKVYRILFVDEENSSLSLMAQAIASKNHPNSGAYSSAGRNAASQIDPKLADCMDARGITLTELTPKTIDYTARELADFHVIVSLQGAVKEYFSTIPFHTVYLEWDLGAPPEGLEPGEMDQRCEELYRELSLQIRDLMEKLRGEGAD